MCMGMADTLKEIITDWDAWGMGLFPTMAAIGHYFESMAMVKATRFKREGHRFTFAEFVEEVTDA